MKTRLLSVAGTRPASLLFCSFLAIHANASAADVDTELLLLVDVSGSVSTSEYNLMMKGYASAFRQSSVLESIQSGARGSIAVALAFWSAANQQKIGVDWTMISDQESANSFADSLGKLSRPYSSTTALGSAIQYGSELFGTETGGADNGFSSLVQVIDVGGDGEDNASPWAKADNAESVRAARDGALKAGVDMINGLPIGKGEGDLVGYYAENDVGGDGEDNASPWAKADNAESVRAARDGALKAGVDMINGLPIGKGEGDLVGYYAENVVGGSAGEVKAFVQPTANFADIEKSLTTKLTREVGAAAVQSIQNISAVPEPGFLPLFAGSLGMLLLVRRRNP